MNSSRSNASIGHRIERDEVVAGLLADVPGLLSRHGIKGRRCGDEFRTKVCPSCGPRAREAVAINLRTGKWKCHAHGCGGDVLDLLGGLAGVDPSRRFRELLELGAEIAGIAASRTTPAERAQIQAERRRREEQARQLEAEQATARELEAVETASARWALLPMPTDDAKAYLAGRGVSAVADLGLIRSDVNSIAIALLTADAQVVNVVRRRTDAGEPKVLGMRGCPTAGTFINSIADITHGREVVLVEGVFDGLTARLVWPDAVVLGAHGAGNIPKIVAAAMPRIRIARTSLTLVPHADQAGEQAMIAAGRIALHAGLKLGETLQVLELEGGDLNESWCAGWRPECP